VAAAEGVEPRRRAERRIEPDVRPLDAGQRRAEVRIIGAADRQDFESQVQEAVPDVRIQPAALQDFDEVDEAERHVERGGHVVFSST